MGEFEHPEARLRAYCAAVERLRDLRLLLLTFATIALVAAILMSPWLLLDPTPLAPLFSAMLAFFAASALTAASFAGRVLRRRARETPLLAAIEGWT